MGRLLELAAKAIATASQPDEGRDPGAKEANEAKKAPPRARTESSFGRREAADLVRAMMDRVGDLYDGNRDAARDQRLTQLEEEIDAIATTGSIEELNVALERYESLARELFGSRHA